MGKVKKILRKIIFCRDNETILDCLNRHKYHFLKKIYFKKFSIDDFEESLKKVGIGSGDIIFLQSSWRPFIGFQGKPEDVIEAILNIIGDDGVLMVPSFSGDEKKIDIKNDSSKLGIISEEFRKNYSSIRSLDAFFPISGKGKNVNCFLEKHVNSKKPFDSDSPLNKLLEKNGKLLFLGLGKTPYKVSMIHLFTTLQSEKQSFYKNCYTKTITSEIIGPHQNFQKKVIVRNHNCSNNNKLIKKMMKNVKHESTKLCLLDLYVCESQTLFNEMNLLDKKNFRFYKVKKGKG
ncbi:AAC(3) family N-acetyltransferase [Vagococcus sp.]|uniref:AAC(3) family N-acetyltransferase n=1 Tax=Vagococcus sp. TaxID=1933889 RepID=UPI002FC95C43